MLTTVTNFTKYFSTERDVYCQNISGCNVSVSFDVGPGHTESFLFPATPDPINLSRYIPFAAIKSSMDFRKMLNRRPPALRLLDEEDFLNHYQKSAEKLGLDSVEAAVDHAEEKINAIRNHQPLPNAPDPIKLHEVVEDDLIGKKIVKPLEQLAEDEQINARVLNICLQAHPQLEAHQRMSAADMLSELEVVAPQLKSLDWEYVHAHSPYKSVKQYANKHLEEAASQEFTEEEEAPKKAPKAPKAKKVVKKVVSQAAETATDDAVKTS